MHGWILPASVYRVLIIHLPPLLFITWHLSLHACVHVCMYVGNVIVVPPAHVTPIIFRISFSLFLSSS